VSLDATADDINYTHDTQSIQEDSGTAALADNVEYGKCSTKSEIVMELYHILTESCLNKVTALYDFEGQSAEELSFKEGDRIILLGRDEEGWWNGKL
jgi:hypothetical protein